MSTIRCIYYGAAPDFPATDQHPAAVRYTVTVSSVDYLVDAIGGKPTVAEMRVLLDPPPAETPAQKVAARLGMTLSELKAALAAANGPAPA
jgi:hypothetical protein